MRGLTLSLVSAGQWKFFATIFLELCCQGLGALEIWVSSTSFQKNEIGCWPQQPRIERLLKFNKIFHDSTQFFFSKHRNKPEFKSLDD